MFSADLTVLINRLTKLTETAIRVLEKLEAKLDA